MVGAGIAMAQTEGEPIPNQVIYDLTQIDPSGQESGESETSYGDFHYRMTFTRNAGGATQPEI